MNGSNNRKPVQPVRRNGSHGKTMTRSARRRRRRNIQRLKMALLVVVLAVILAAIVLAIIRPGKMDSTAANQPTAAPTAAPTVEASAAPTAVPTTAPTATPVPTAVPQATLSPELAAKTAGGLRLTGETAGEKMPYQVYVSKDSYTIAILGIDESGEYTRPLRTYRTAIGTGNKTRAGSYNIEKKWQWYEWSLGGYTPCTSLLGGSKIRLHAPLHNENGDWNSLWREGYRQIGTKETQGCLRTTTEGAAWVFFNCDIGTEVRIANDAKYASEEPPELGDSKSDPTRPKSWSDLEVPVTFFTVDKEEIQLSAGTTYQTAVFDVVPSNEKISHRFTYTSGNPGVATVDENGIITAVASGTTQVLVMADDVNKTYRVINVTVNM